MTFHRTPTYLAIAWLLVSTTQGFAGNAAPTPDLSAAGQRPSSTHRPDKIRTKRTVTHHLPTKGPLDAEQTDTATERDASLERRRKAFFADKPDDAPPGDGSSAPVGVTLGGSGGLRPEIGLKF